MTDIMARNLTNELQRIEAKTLVINGRFDTNVAPVVAFRLSKQIPGATLKFFERSGHSHYAEEPVEFAATLERFLGQ